MTAKKLAELYSLEKLKFSLFSAEWSQQSYFGAPKHIEDGIKLLKEAIKLKTNGK